MRARIKATGEIINVEIHKSVGGNQLYVGRSNWDGIEYTFSGDELEPINESVNEPTKYDWQQVHIQAAIAAMQGMLANPAHQKVQVESGELFGYFYAMNAIMCADVLVAELKKKGGDSGQKEADH